jgi:hypothetical protein
MSAAKQYLSETFRNSNSGTVREKQAIGMVGSRTGANYSSMLSERGLSDRRTIERELVCSARKALSKVES